ncbi:MAG TPA: hypothetical protein EYP19_08485 [Desulfobacterales bacterium]|nr:hypothetical protein [Desulfobacterales bacterium]
MNDHRTEQKAHTSYLDHVIDSAGGTSTVSSLDSLSRALKVGFLIMKVLMMVLAVVFLFSNIFWVPEGYVGVQSRFGKIVGKGTASIRPPGGPYLAFPYPLDKIVRIPTTIQKISLFNAFWSEKEEMEPVIDDRPESEGLRPGVHGSLVTADKNIVQGIWVIHYKLGFGTEDSKGVSSVTDFIRNVGSMERAEAIIRRIAQTAIVHTIARTTVESFAAGQIDNNEIKGMISTHFTRLKTGITVTGVSASRYAVPKILIPDFQAVNQAESQKALAIEKASRHRVAALHELAGSGWRELLEAIETHERTVQSGQKAAERAAFEAAKEIFLAGEIGGSVKQILDEAKSEKTATIQRARASAARFSRLLSSYEKNPDVLESQLIQDTIKEIWSDISVDALYIPPGQKLFLDIGRNHGEEK